METKRFLGAVIVPLMGLTSIASAQTEKPQSKPPPRPAEARAEPVKAMPFCHKASEVIGCKVKNPQGEDLGKVEELVIRPSGEIEYAVLSFGGFLGLGDKLFAIPYGTLKAPEVPEESRLAYFTLNLDKSRLEKAPGFPKNNWPDIQSPTWCSEIDKYYGAGRSIEAGQAVDQNKNFRLCKASELIGKDVLNTTNDELGEVKELVLDPRGGRVNYFVLSSGGFLGMGDKLFAIPWEALKLQPDGDKQKLVLPVTKDRFEKAPEFKEKDWPRMGDRAWVEQVYSYWGFRPYWGAATEAGYQKP